MALDHMGTYRTLSSLSRVQLLYVLQQHGGEKTAAELSQAVGLHHNTVREHLQILVDDGFVLARSEKRESRGRPRVLYTVRVGDETVVDSVATQRLEAAQYRADLLKRVLIGQNAFDPLSDTADEEIEAQLDVLEDHLDQAGFDPHIDQPNLVIDLFACPFRGMVMEHQEMVCSVHFGLIQMMLTLARGPLAAELLLPFMTPGMCRLHLSRVRQSTPQDLPMPRVHVGRTGSDELIITGR